MLHTSRFWIVTALLVLGLATPLAAGAFEQAGPNPNRTVDRSQADWFVAPSGSDSADGKTPETAFATMQKAADMVEPGQTVLVLAGTYDAGFHIAKVGSEGAWINFVAEPGVEIRGSKVRKDWVREPGDSPIYSIPRPNLLGHWQSPDTELTSRLEQVFVNGALLRQVPEKAMLKPRGVFYVDDAEKKLYACLQDGADPNAEKTEVTEKTWAIAIGGPPNTNFWRDPQVGLKNKAGFIRIDGFKIRHIGNFSRFAAIQVRGICHDIVIENCDVQWVNYGGISANTLTIFGDNNEWLSHITERVTVRHCIASNNGAQGMGGGGVNDFRLEYNLMVGNNYKGISPWNEGGAIKTGFDGKNIVIRGNVALNNHNHGLWIDYGAEGSVFENNFVYNAIAGAILNEVTPTPGNRLLPDGTREAPSFTAEEARAVKQAGSIIRNNILIGTRPPGGGGINVSSSCDTKINNNIIAYNTGGGINYGGSPDRKHIQGQFRNEAWANICLGNHHHATVLPDENDKHNRTFDNVMRDNLFIDAKADKPFRIGGEDAGPEEFEAYNKGAKNFYADAHPFKDPEHFDFTITNPEMIAQIGFDPEALRLDWTEYYQPPETKERKQLRRSFTTIDLSGLYNRALADETAGDGQGGWTDQGGNDLSKFPLDAKEIDGVPYQLGTLEAGAVMLKNEQVPGDVPSSVEIPAAGRFDEIFFLYTGAWLSGIREENGEKVRIDTPEVAHFVIHYTDGSESVVPLIINRQILDWWNDPTWREWAGLNDHGVYEAWMGPNSEVARVAVFYMKWQNQEPDKEIASVTVSNEGSNAPGAFFLLGVTGASKDVSGGGPRVFYMPFDGDVDAIDSMGEFIEAEGFNRAAFNAGSFVDGHTGKAFVPAKPIYFPVPDDFPLDGEGSISLWLNPEDWRSPERMENYRKTDYTRVMTPFEGRQHPSRYSVWAISFEIDKEGLDKLFLSVNTCGTGSKMDVTDRVRSGEWFHVLTTWEPHPEKQNHTRRWVYFNDELIDTKDFQGKPDLIGERLYVGVPKNGGQPWRGAMDELEISNKSVHPQTP